MRVLNLDLHVNTSPITLLLADRPHPCGLAISILLSVSYLNKPTNVLSHGSALANLPYNSRQLALEELGVSPFGLVLFQSWGVLGVCMLPWKYLILLTNQIQTNTQLMPLRAQECSRAVDFLWICKNFEIRSIKVKLQQYINGKNKEKRPSKRQLGPK